jgi:hypothetical protein
MKDFKDLFNISPEKMAEIKADNLARLKSRDLNYDLGYLVGESITPSFPGLSIDMIKRGKLITVSPEEEKVYNTLSNTWSISQDIEDWDRMQKYYKTIEHKYLPKTHKTYVGAVNIKDMEQFKKGLSFAILMCDHSHYSIKTKDISVEYDENYYYLKIKLKLRK